MNSTRVILSKTLVRTFYRQHAGLLLFVFYIFFGVVSGSDLVYYHLSLVRAVLDSTLLLFVVLALWILYAIKALYFFRAQLFKEEMSFLLLIENFSSGKKRTELFVVQTMIMIPVLLYGLFIFIVAVEDARLGEAIIFLFAMVAVVAVPAYLMERMFDRTHKKLRWLNIRIQFAERIEFVYLRFIFRHMNFGVAVSKILSLLLIFGLLTGFGLDNYDVRLPLLAILIAAATHSMIVFNVQQFEVNALGFIKQNPVSFFRRVYPLVLTYGILLLPEIILLVRVYLRLAHFEDLPVIILFGMLWLMVLHAISYFGDSEKERFQFVIFFFVALSFFLIIFHLQWLTIAAFIAIIFWGMKHWYLSYEPGFE